MTTKEIFCEKLREVFARAVAHGKSHVEVTARDLHIAAGNYPDPKRHRMPLCCDVMYNEMVEGDKVIDAPPKGKGASLRIRYQLPRP